MTLLNKRVDLLMIVYICFTFQLLVNLSNEFSRYSVNSPPQEPNDDFMYLKALCIATKVVDEAINKIQMILKIPLFILKQSLQHRRDCFYLATHSIMQSFYNKRVKWPPVSINQNTVDQSLTEIRKQSEFCAWKYSVNESNIVISFDKGDVTL